ncbi:ribonuclease HII [Kaistia algarum]|uniref:ribonuclease HII n=1 Tax=Kaistia algarum TaxID=2083279 RepID=UPI000CE7D6AE|nr:ribonuclease HII [Kaistia algarum]MCX5512342.1 ribonuclease HII [Kaistia algarum]PPE80428.1 ribonuclease HII [Kaistia algarum]
MARRPAESPLLFELPPAPTDSIERRLRRLGSKRVTGIDEAGRGPLAGPVVAAAVILDPRNIPEGLDDSKKLSRPERERLFALILANAVVSVAAASVGRIGATDIRQATLWAMRRAAAGLPLVPDYAIVDGIDVPPGLPCASEALVKGDARSVSIAAASIVAKVTRDRMMIRAAGHFPRYGFDRHMGYGTAFHLTALREHGACALHRTTFAPVRAVLTNENAAGWTGGVIFEELILAE